MKTSAFIYSSMLLRILNKEYALSMDLDSYYSVTFCINRFFMERVWMYENEDVIFTYAKSNIVGNPNPSNLVAVSDLYSGKNIKTLDELFEFLKEICPKMKSMSFRYFIQCYINTYKDTALFSVECLQYFLFVVEAALIGSFLVNQPMITDITKTTKNMNRFYPELVKAII